MTKIIPIVVDFSVTTSPEVQDLLVDAYRKGYKSALEDYDIDPTTEPAEYIKRVL